MTPATAPHPRTLPLGLASVSTAVLLWALAPAALAPAAEAQSGPQARSESRQIRATQSRPAPRNTTTPGRYRGEGRYRGAGVTHGRPKHPVSPYLGSAIGHAAPHHRYGPYRQHHSKVPVYPSYPTGYRPPAYIFYVDPYYDGEPRVYGEAEPRREAPQQPVVVQPAPVYIVQPVAGVVPGTQALPAGRAAGNIPGPAAAPSAQHESPEPPPIPRPEVPQAVAFRLVPGDATVLLDDEHLGTAGEVMARSPLILDPGVYVLEVSHPDFPSQRLVFGVDGREGVTVAVDLGAAKPHRRTRVQ